MTAGTSRSEQLIAANSARWEQAQAMRFVGDVADDTVPDAVFARYLVFERQFVDTAARLCGAAVRTAPDSAALLGHATSLHNLVTEQHDYFTDVLATLGPHPAVPAAAQRQADELTHTVLDIADTHGYPGIVTSLFTAEEMYRQWCVAAARRPSGRAAIAEWVELHTREPFLGQVEFLRAEVDRLDLDPAGERALAGVLGRTVDAEITFHDAAFLN